MRIRHWLARLLGGALWTATATLALAQPPYDAGMYGDPGATTGYVPYVDAGSPAAAGYPIPYSGMQAASWPEGATAWPQISPYEAPPVDRHHYHNGFWYNQQAFGGRKYYVNLSATLNRMSDPKNDVVGNPNAPQFFGFANIANQQQNVLTSGLPAFEAHHWSDIDALTSGGFQGMMGFFNADDSGVQLNGFWADQASGSLVLEIPGIDINNTTDLFRRAEDLLSNHGALPIVDGQLPPTLLPIVPPNGTQVQVDGAGAQPYDIFYKLFYHSEAYGIGTSYFASPVYDSGSTKIRPNVGLRYMQVRERAVFNAANSGLTYTFDQDVERPDPATIAGTVDILESYLNSNVRSQLAGPEVGFRMDVGDEKFLIWTNTKFGLMANHSVREIGGFGILRREAMPDPTVVPTADVTAFKQQETTTTVSPMFEQSIYARSQVLSYVPGIRKMKLFEEAQFQIGYTFTLVGAIYRPGEDVQWNGFPNFPQITNAKGTWFMSSLSLGVEWNF
jgi:hypothetical protein